MMIGMPVYDGVDLLDVAGPHEMFGWVPPPSGPWEVVLAAECQGNVRTRDGFTFGVTTSFAEAKAFDVLWVPGGEPAALNRLIREPSRTYLDFLVAQSRSARIVASVCEGAMLLAAAGLLDGYIATTHWAFVRCLRQYSQVKLAPGHPRFVHDGNRLTGGGISSGLDEALALIEHLAGREAAVSVQQTTQYYPQPPISSTIPNAVGCPLDGAVR